MTINDKFHSFFSDTALGEPDPTPEKNEPNPLYEDPLTVNNLLELSHAQSNNHLNVFINQKITNFRLEMQSEPPVSAIVKKQRIKDFGIWCKHTDAFLQGKEQGVFRRTLALFLKAKDQYAQIESTQPTNPSPLTQQELNIFFASFCPALGYFIKGEVSIDLKKLRLAYNFFNLAISTSGSDVEGMAIVDKAKYTQALLIYEKKLSLKKLNKKSPMSDKERSFQNYLWIKNHLKNNSLPQAKALIEYAQYEYHYFAGRNVPNTFLFYLKQIKLSELTKEAIDCFRFRIAIIIIDYKLPMKDNETINYSEIKRQQNGLSESLSQHMMRYKVVKYYLENNSYPDAPSLLAEVIPFIYFCKQDYQKAYEYYQIALASNTLSKECKERCQKAIDIINARPFASITIEPEQACDDSTALGFG